MAITGELIFPDVPGKINEHNQNPTAHSIRIENDLTNPTEGKAADAKAVKNLVDTVSGQIEGDIDDLGGEVTDLKSALKGITGNSVIPLVATNRYIDLSGSSVTMSGGEPQLSDGTTAFSVFMVQCSGGDKFTINGTGGTSTRLWGFVSSTGSILSKADASVSATNLVVSAPTNSAWLICHTNDNLRSYVGEVIIKKVNDIDQSLAETNIELNRASLFEETNYTVTFEHGTIDLINGSDSVNNTRIRCDMHTIEKQRISIQNGAKYAFRFYDSNNSFVHAPTGVSYIWYTVDHEIKDIVQLFPGAKKFRLVLAYSDDSSTATSSEMNTLIEKTSISNKTSKVTRLNFELGEALPIIASFVWQIGSIGVNNGQDGVSTTRQRTYDYIDYVPSAIINIESGAKYNLFAYDKNKEFLWGFGIWQTKNGVIKDIITANGKSDSNIKYIRFSCAYSNDATITDVPTLAAYFSMSFNGSFQSVYNDNKKLLSPNINSSGLGNFSIRCAKEQSYVDGSAPVIEWFLLEEPKSGKFYYSTDLKNRIYLFTFPYDTYKYSFGILQNGDIVACLDADSIETQNKSDSNRVNPYVFLASENWTICHEVDFGSSLKPCGWLSNCGFKVLADGSAIFCEYTRQTTYTANVWKLNGDPTDSTNWIVTKSFVVTSTDNSTLFKHCHMVMQDFYTGICYMATGDDNIGAMLYYSSDNGSTWTQLVSPDSDGQTNQYGYINGSEKYCRMLTMTFTEDYIYWASDTPTENYHYLFRAQRNNSGVLDYTTVEDYVNIPLNNGASTYGTAYIPEYNAILLLDRCDNYASEMLVKMVLLDNGTLVTIGTLYPTAEEISTGSNLGFRTRFSEWYPTGGLVHVGYGLRGNHENNDINHNRGFGNTGTWIIGGGANNINNLSVQVFKIGDNYKMRLGTEY